MKLDFVLNSALFLLTLVHDGSPKQVTMTVEIRQKLMKICADEKKASGIQLRLLLLFLHPGWMGGFSFTLSCVDVTVGGAVSTDNTV